MRPNLILNAEKELGIVAGLQDRVAQVYGGLVYMVRDANIHYWQLCSCKHTCSLASVNSVSLISCCISIAS